MLKFHKNPFDTLTELKIAMGLDPHPLWMLIFNKVDCTYSAVNYKDDQDITDYSLKNNLIGVCLVDPASLINVLEFSEPNLICEALFEWCSMKRPDPEHILLIDFIPPKGFISEITAIIQLRTIEWNNEEHPNHNNNDSEILDSNPSAPVDIDCSSVPFIGSSHNNGTDPVDGIPEE